MGTHQLVQCVGCGAWVAPSEGATHPYIGASAGCWAVYGEVLAAEYLAGHLNLHRLLGDSYAVQHPGTASRQAIQSVAVHLISLYYVLERGYSADKAMGAMRYALQHADRFFWLEPPAPQGTFTILQVQQALGSPSFAETVQAWAQHNWQAWQMHRETIERWAAGA